MARREPGAAASARLEDWDPDRIAAHLARLSVQAFVSVLIYRDYASREMLDAAITAELENTWGLDVHRAEIRTPDDLRRYLIGTGGDVCLVVGLEDCLPTLAEEINVARDKLALRHTVIWLQEGRYPDLAVAAPDLTSYIIPLKPEVAGAMAPPSVLRPELAELEKRWGLTTIELMRAVRQGQVADIPEEVVHLWLALARALRIS